MEKIVVDSKRKFLYDKKNILLNLRKEGVMKKSLFRFSIFPLILLLCLTFSCQQEGEQVAEEAKPAVDVEADIAAINELWPQYAAAVTAGDMDLWISLWTDDGIQMPPDTPARIGKEQIRVAIQSSFNLYQWKMTINNEEVRVAGDWAFSRGTYSFTMTPKEEGETIKGTGKYLTILERQVDGSWKIAIDCFNYNAPPSEK